MAAKSAPRQAGGANWVGGGGGGGETPLTIGKSEEKHRKMMINGHLLVDLPIENESYRGFLGDLSGI